MSDEPPSKTELFLASLSTFTSNFIGRMNDAWTDLVDKKDEDHLSKQNVLHSFISGTGGVHLVGGSGDIPNNNLGTTQNVYVHMKMPYTTSDNLDFMVEVEGYNYGSAKIVSCKVVCRIKDGVFTFHVDPESTQPTNAYVSASGDLMVSVFFSLIYYTTMTVSAWCSDDNKTVVPGQIQGRTSLSSTMDF